MEPRAILASVLDETAATLPSGTRGRDVTDLLDECLRFDFVTEYEPALAFGRPPFLRTVGSFHWTGQFNERVVERLHDVVRSRAAQHLKDWESIHGPEVAAAAKKWAAEQAVAT